MINPFRNLFKKKDGLSKEVDFKPRRIKRIHSRNHNTKGAFGYQGKI